MPGDIPAADEPHLGRDNLDNDHIYLLGVMENHIFSSNIVPRFKRLDYRLAISHNSVN